MHISKNSATQIVEEISKLLKIDFKEMITLNNKLIEMIYKKAKNRNMV